ncbi:NusA-like transcription termination signal-binding factor [Candidatus Woesearchaeota archaeon]|nr:NusA-like transcription termination signal-binding factor [Candidatus Woesearchaeota archaeon]
MKLDQRLLGYITTFETVTKTEIKDCFVNKNDQVVFVVKQGQGGKAIGKGAVNVKRIERMLQRKIKIIEFNENVVEFVKNAIYPLKSPEIILNEDKVIIKTDTTYLKALLLGRDKLNFKELQNLVNKYFNISIEIQ